MSSSFMGAAVTPVGGSLVISPSSCFCSTLMLVFVVLRCFFEEKDRQTLVSRLIADIAFDDSICGVYVVNAVSKVFLCCLKLDFR